MSSAGNVNAVFYAKAYHPIQAGSIDGTDILPHDNAVYRALLCSSAGLYDPFGDPKVIGDPYCTLFVGRLSRLTSEETLQKAMSKYGRVKNMRLVRDIVTGASRGYAFVEYETEKEMRRAYEDAHHTYIDDCEVIVDYYRQHLMPGWIPRRLGGGLGGKKESGQLRFGGRERPFRAPLRPIPYDDLKRLGISPPPEGKYLSRYQATFARLVQDILSNLEKRYLEIILEFLLPTKLHTSIQVPSPPRRNGSHREREQSPSTHRRFKDREEISHSRSKDREETTYRRSKEGEDTSHRGSKDRDESSRQRQRSSFDKDGEDMPHRRSTDRDESSRRRQRSPFDKDGEHTSHRRSKDRGESSRRRQRSPSDKDWGDMLHRKSKDRDESSRRRQRSPFDKDGEDMSHRKSKDRDESSRRRQRSPSDKDGEDMSYRKSKDRDDSSRRRQRSPTDSHYSLERHHKHRRSEHSHRHQRSSTPRDENY